MNRVRTDRFQGNGNSFNRIADRDIKVEKELTAIFMFLLITD